MRSKNHKTALSGCRLRAFVIPKGKERIKAAVFADMLYEEEMI